MTLNQLKKGEWFTLKPIEYPKESQVYVRGDYERSEKKYSCSKWSDINAERFLKGTTVVYTEFIF